MLGRSADGPTAPLAQSARDVMLGPDALVERPDRRLGRGVRALTGTDPESETSGGQATGALRQVLSSIGRRVEGIATGGIAPAVRAWQDVVHNGVMQTGDQGNWRHSRTDGMDKPASELRHAGAADPHARTGGPMTGRVGVSGEVVELARALSGVSGASSERITRSGELVGGAADREARPVLDQLRVEAAFPTGVAHGASARAMADRAPASRAMVPTQGAPRTRVTHEVVFRLSADGETTRILLGNRAFRDAVVNEIRTWNAKQAPATL